MWWKTSVDERLAPVLTFFHRLCITRGSLIVICVEIAFQQWAIIGKANPLSLYCVVVAIYEMFFQKLFCLEDLIAIL
jgi:hypothetical protein